MLVWVVLLRIACFVVSSSAYPTLRTLVVEVGCMTVSFSVGVGMWICGLASASGAAPSVQLTLVAIEFLALRAGRAACDSPRQLVLLRAGTDLQDLPWARRASSTNGGKPVLVAVLRCDDLTVRRVI